MKIRRINGRLTHPPAVEAVLAIFCAVVFHQCVYGSFERQRVRVVRTPQVAALGAVTVPLPDLSALAGQPVAFILRIANDTSTAGIVRVAVGATVVDDISLPPDQEIRVDLDLPDGGALANEHVVLISDRGGWSLTALEVANIHGFSSGLFEFVVVPATAGPLVRLGLLPALAVLAVVLLVPGFPRRGIENPFARRAYLIGASLSLLFLAAVLIAPWVSDFAVLLAPHTFVLCLVMLYCTAQRVWAYRFQLLYVASAVLFIVSIARLYEPDTGLTALIRFGDALEERVLPSVRAVPHDVLEDSAGYDGQFHAQLAVDPLLRDPGIREALDNPLYRARRILFSWTAYLFGLGQPRWILQAYAVQYVVLWLVLAWVLCRWFPPKSFRNLCLWFGCMFSHGMVVSVRWALPDGAGLLLLTLSVLAMERGRTAHAAGIVGIASLAKEVNLLWSTVLLVPGGFNRQGWRERWLWGLLVAGPLSVWMLYLLAGDVGGSFAGVQNFGAPFTGYVQRWNVILPDLHDFGSNRNVRFALIALIGLTTQAAVLLCVREWRNAWWRIGVVSVVLMVFLGSAVWEGYPAAVTRVLLPMTFAFNAVLPRNAGFWPLFALGNLSVLQALETLRMPFWNYP